MAKKLKKYSWAKAVDCYKKLVEKKLPLMFPDYKKDFNSNECYHTAKMYLYETDEFHPVNNDMELSGALDKNDWEFLEDALVQCIKETFEHISEYFSEPWNFGPGYKVPKILDVDCCWWETLKYTKTDVNNFKKEVFSEIKSKPKK